MTDATRTPVPSIRQCELPGCTDPLEATLLCIKHYAQRAKTTVTSEEFIAAFAAQAGKCPYCLNPLGVTFCMDHHHGSCTTSHPRGRRMCRECLRGMIHRECNEELRWVERALGGQRIDSVAGHVGTYLSARPFRGA